MKFLRANPNLGAVLILAVIYLLLPVGFMYIDSFVYIHLAPSSNIPHYPPLYPILLGSIKWLLGVNSLFVWAAMGINFVLLAGAYLYWQTIIPVSINRYAALAAFLLFNFYLLLSTKSFSSESVFMPCILMFFTASVHIGRSKGFAWVHILVFVTALSVACLTRYIGLILGVLLPLYLSILAIKSTRLFWKKLVLSMTLLLMVIVVNKIITTACIKALHTSTEATYGCAGAYRIFLTLDDAQAPIEKAAMVQSWKSHTNDAELLMAMDSLAAAKEDDLWLTVFNKVKATLAISHPEYTTQQMDGRVNSLFNRAFLYLLKDANPHYFARIFREDVPLFFSCHDIVQYINDNNDTYHDLSKIDYSPKNDAFWRKYIHHYPDVAITIGITLAGIINIFTLLLIGKVLWEKWKGRLQFDEWALVIAVLVIFMGYQFAAAAVTIFLPRYGVPAHCLLAFWVTLTICRHPEWLPMRMQKYMLA